MEKKLGDQCSIPGWVTVSLNVSGSHPDPYLNCTAAHVTPSGCGV